MTMDRAQWVRYLAEALGKNSNVIMTEPIPVKPLKSPLDATGRLGSSGFRQHVVMEKGKNVAPFRTGKRGSTNG